jgi:hypothetical protein
MPGSARKSSPHCGGDNFGGVIQPFVFLIEAERQKIGEINGEK